MRKTILLFSLVAAVAVIMPSCSSNPAPAPEQTAQIKKGYQCPMKCEGDKAYAMPGKCPACGMALEKMAVDSAAREVKTDTAKKQ